MSRTQRIAPRSSTANRGRKLIVQCIPAFVLAASLLAGCRSSSANQTIAENRSRDQTASNNPPAIVIGDFEDDYGAKFSISRELFFQRSRNRFHIVQWNVRDRYFIAQNDSLNPSDAGKWTRIDWMPLSGMPPFEWAFCFSAYNAATRSAAEAAAIAKRDTPKTGCNGFPFTRMKRSSSVPK